MKNKKGFLNSQTQLTLILAVSLTHSGFAAQTKLTPEQETLALAKRLKPIPDEDWRAIAGSHVTEKYSIAKGDTLSDISKRLFGDPKYWPKIWALNNDQITNPHKLSPGFLIAFSPGTGGSLPSVAITTPSSNDSASETDAPKSSLKSKKGRSEEWRNLPKQKWESYQVILPPEVDPLGFDRRNRISIGKPTALDPESVPASQKFNFLGQIIGSRAESSFLSLDDLIYIRPDETLQVGETYTITREPNVLKSRKSDRIGYSYPVLGRVKILGIRDNLLIGKITHSRALIARGDSLIPNVSKLTQIRPIPGPEGVQGVLILDRTSSTYTTAQHKEVFIDRGSDDGVQPGMVFRAYGYFDPSNEKKITESEVIIDGDFLVTQVSPQFSTAIVLNSWSPISEHSQVTLLTDVTDVLRNLGFTEKGSKHGNELDELDLLDDQESLGKGERRELRQLERWRGNPSPTPTLDSNEPLPPPPPSEPEALPTPEANDPSLDSETPPSDSVAPNDPSLDSPPPPPSETESAPLPDPAPSSLGDGVNLTPVTPDTSPTEVPPPLPPPGDTAPMPQEPSTEPDLPPPPPPLENQ